MAAVGIDVRGKITADGTMHRAHVEGDRARSETAWYVLHMDEHPAGAFGCWKRYGRQKFTWASKDQNEKWTPEQRRQWTEKLERQRQEREEEEYQRHLAAADHAQELWDSFDDADESHPYCKRKKCKAYGLKVGPWDVANPDTGEITRVSNLALIVPIRDTRKKIWSLQAIFPSSSNPLRRGKDYLKDGAKFGYFYTIGQPRDNVILLCEGYSTGATLHEATEHAVAIAFDTSNLEEVACILRERFPGSRIVVCSDNDRWVTKPIENPGLHYATAAAIRSNGVVALPDFKDLATKPTDFNDLAVLEGHEAVRRFIEEALETEPESPEPQEQTAPAEPEEPPALEGELIPREEDPSPASSTDNETDDEDEVSYGNGMRELLKNPFFEILGFDHGTYFFFHKTKRQIMEYDRSQFGESTFIELAEPSLFWQRHFKGGSKKEGFNKSAATNFLMRAAESRGIYDRERMRGRGAWFDDGRIVYHHGDFLTADGERKEIGEFKSRYIYEMQRALPLIDQKGLTDAEGENLLDLAGDFRWSKPASGALLCGWIMLAPICGALRWRPHIWLSGGAGSGKSTLLNEFVHPLLNGFDLFAQGNTTEAGLRQKLQTDALPILFEESEQNEDKDRMRIQHVLSLIRQSSTESHARVYKGTMGGQSMEFLIRSMFCLASIQVGIKHQADIERVSVLALKPKKDPTRDTFGEWDRLRNRLYETIIRDPGIGPRLVKRATSMIPIIKQNVEVFSNVAARIFGSAREGDQYGALLAGNWCLINSAVATETDALGLIKSYSWEEHRDTADTDESEVALSALMGNRLRAPKGHEFTVHELVASACGHPVAGAEIDKIDADTILRRYGMIVKDGYLLLSNNSVELRDIMAHTNFAADWRGVLLRVPGADRNENRAMRFNGVNSKCIRIPTEPLLKLSGEAVQQSWLTADQPVER